MDTFKDMSRKRKDEDLEKIEELERTNKSLRTINRSLMRHLKKLDRQFKPEQIYQEAERFNGNECPECTKGTTRQVSLGPRTMDVCDLCGYNNVKKTK